MTATLEPTLDELDAIVPDAPEVKEDEGRIASVPCPLFQEVDGKQVSVVTLFNNAKKLAADWTAVQASLGAQLKSVAEPLRIAQAATSKEMIKSIILDGQLRYTCSNKFSAVKPAMFPEVLAAFGPDGFKQYIADDIQYEVDRPALVRQKSDADVYAAFVLLRKRGILPQTRTGKPTELLFRDITFNPDVRAKALALGIVPQSLLALPKAVSK